jgi:hypothetical protein
MPRVEARISGTVRGDVDISAIQRSVAEIVKNITGNSCQVVVNTTSTSGIAERINAYKMKQGMQRGNIEMRP